MSDEDSTARLRAALDGFGAAVAEAFKLGMRQAIAKQIAEDHGPGPWVLYPDGRVEPHLTVVPPKPRQRQRRTKTQTEKETP